MVTWYSNRWRVSSLGMSIATFSLLLNKFSVLPNAMEDDRFAAFIFCLKHIKIFKWITLISTGIFYFKKNEKHSELISKYSYTNFKGAKNLKITRRNVNEIQSASSWSSVPKSKHIQKFLWWIFENFFAGVKLSLNFTFIETHTEI